MYMRGWIECEDTVIRMMNKEMGLIKEVTLTKDLNDEYPITWMTLMMR